MTKIPKIHVLVPDIFQFKGGIQIYSVFLIQALEQVLPNYDRYVFLKNDAKMTEELKFDPLTQFQFAGSYAYY
jgi:hypothetical protein